MFHSMSKGDRVVVTDRWHFGQPGTIEEIRDGSGLITIKLDDGRTVHGFEMNFVHEGDPLPNEPTQNMTMF